MQVLISQIILGIVKVLGMELVNATQGIIRKPYDNTQYVGWIFSDVREAELHCDFDGDQWIVDLTCHGAEESRYMVISESALNDHFSDAGFWNGTSKGKIIR